MVDVLVTGGAGFIGGALIWKLNQLGTTDILVVDNLASTDKWKNLAARRIGDYLHRDAFPDWLAGHGEEVCPVEVHTPKSSRRTEAMPAGAPECRWKDRGAAKRGRARGVVG